MIKTIIFDWGGVITPYGDHKRFADQYHKQFGLEKSELLDVLHRDWHQAADNNMSAKEYWTGVGVSLSIDPLKIKKLVMDSFPIETRIVTLINRIKDDYILVMMSNQIEDWLEEVIDENDLRDKFHYFINSYQVKVSKPDKRIFEIALEKTGSKPEETLFIDDLESNIEAAKKLGIKTIKFQTYNQFLKKFKKLVPGYQPRT